MKKKDLVLSYIQRMVSMDNEDKLFTTQELVEHFHMQRTNLSSILNQLVKDNKLEKIDGRPVLYRFITLNQIEEEYNMIFQRTELLIGKENLEKLQNSHVIVFGVGGVGGFVIEALARAGVGELSIVDFDTVDITNLNRQIIALQNTIGKLKTSVMKDRLLSINPDIRVHEYPEKFSMENYDKFFKNKKYNYIVDAIDLVTSKLALAEIAQNTNTPIISSMGTGNKIEPTMLEVADIYKTSVCPLARVMRKELKNRKIKKLKVVYSREIPRKPENETGSREKKVNVGSISFVPSSAGLIIASEVVKDICNL